MFSLDQSKSVVKQNQCISRITFDTRLKIALIVSLVKLFSYVHNCPKSLCMISRLEFVLRNVPSGRRNSVSWLSSQYPRRPEVFPEINSFSSFFFRSTI